MSDTVGFISDLPTELVAAFRATLEEVLEADLILHIRDASNPEMEDQKRDVMTVLKTLGVEEETPIIEVFNKIDLLLGADRKTFGGNKKAAVSALSGQGVAKLLKFIAKAFDDVEPEVVIKLDEGEGKARAWLYQHGSAIKETKGGLRLNLGPKAIGQFKKDFPGINLKKKKKS